MMMMRKLFQNQSLNVTLLNRKWRELEIELEFIKIKF